MTGKFAVEIEIPNPDLRWQSGVIGRARLPKHRTADVVAVPRDAVLPGRAGPSVFVVEGDRARRRQVELGADQGLMVVVDRGLEPGEQLVVRGQRDLRDGSLVAVTETATDAGRFAAGRPAGDHRRRRGHPHRRPGRRGGGGRPMKLTQGAIRRYPMIFAFMVIITLLGVSSYLGLPRESSPDVKIPFVMVIAPYAGTSPEDMENLVTRKLEKQLKGLEDLKEMTSSSSYGMSSITLEFESRVDMSDALQSVRDRVELAKPDLPVDPRNDLMVQEISAADAFPVMQVNLSGDIDLFVLKKIGEDLQEELEQIKGVLGVDLVGGIENEVQVDVDPEKLVYYDLALLDVQDAVALQNITIPGGKLSLGVYDYQVRVPGEVAAPREILDFVLNPGIDPPVYLRDVATVSFGMRDRETISRVSGKDAVTLIVKKRSGENIIDIADEVRAAIERLRPRFPAGTEVSIVADQSVQIQDMVSELENNILSGLILVVVVLLAFFGFRNALFVGLAIPFSMLITFIVLRVLGITLNMVVLFSLILALGMLVDNAIVIVENIYRHRGKGKGAEEAADFGTEQVAGAVIASTLTTICAFGPMVFWPGIMGEFMKYLPITVIITLSASLLVALVFNPVLCARFMAVPAADAAAPSSWATG